MPSATCACPKSCCPLPGRCRPPQGWAGSSLHPSPGALHLVRAGHFNGFQRTGNRLQMAAGQMQVECSVADLGMAEQNLGGAQVGAGFQHVSGKAMPERMWRYML